MKEYICYRTKDLEGDVWCERAFLFECGQDVEKFFTKEKIAELFFEGEIEGVKSIVFHKVQPTNEKPYYIEINGGGYNGIEIVEMNMAYYDVGAAMYKKECEDKYNELKKHIKSKNDGKLNEWYLASVHIEDLEKKIKEQKIQIEEYKEFFSMLQKLLPRMSSPHDLIG